MKKVISQENLPKSVIIALADPIKQAKLRTICFRLKEIDVKGKTVDYITGEQISWLELVQYGMDGVKFSKIATVFER